MKRIYVAFVCFALCGCSEQENVTLHDAVDAASSYKHALADLEEQLKPKLLVSLPSIDEETGLLIPPELPDWGLTYQTRDEQTVAAAKFAADVGGVEKARELLVVVEGIVEDVAERRLSIDTERKVLNLIQYE